MKDVPFLSHEAIENRMADALHRAAMMTTVAAPVLDLGAFVQQGLHAVLDDCAPLPANEMGVVTFAAGKCDLVEINRELGDLFEGGGTSRARYRSTLAHEASHIVLHRALLMPNEGQLGLFGAEESKVYAQRCLKRNLATLSPDCSTAPHKDAEIPSKATQRLEIQANIGMAALLMPREVFCAVAEPPLRAWELRRLSDDPHDHFDAKHRMIGEWAAMFEVSRQVIAIRIKTLGLWGKAKNERLSA